MEVELTCPQCGLLYHVPVLLPVCNHCLCLACAATIQQQVACGGIGSSSNGSISSSAIVAGSSSTSTTNADDSEVDKVSVLSDADSGVSSCGSSGGGGGGNASRPTSLVGASSSDNGVGCSGSSGVGSGSSLVVDTCSASSSSFYTLVCPECSTVNKLDDSGAHGLPRYKLMESLVDKYRQKAAIAERCQLCEQPDTSVNPDEILNTNKNLETPRLESQLENSLIGPQRTLNFDCQKQDKTSQSQSSVPAESDYVDSRREATVFCEQCHVFYCCQCRVTCHPNRGPLAAHRMMSVAEGRALLRERRRQRASRCPLHPQEALSMFCVQCHVTMCVACLSSGQHHVHDVHAVTAITQTRKVRLGIGEVIRRDAVNCSLTINFFLLFYPP